ncbi:MAG: hypothetical protein WBQ18_01270, partial [Solirubrobacteraceae bacterium]
MTEPDAETLRGQLEALPGAAVLLARLRPGDAVYLVGGALRDLILGISPLDLDLVVEGDLEPVAAALGEPVRSHARFGTCTVSVDGRRYDLARARTETYSRPGALPTVAPATIDEDLSRRDFTVNALALGLSGPRAGELLAVDGGWDDLRRRELRVIHDASFIDDPTRLLRLVRYATRLPFTVEAHTGALARAAVAAGALSTVGGSRIGAELRLLAAEPDPVAAIHGLSIWRLDTAIARDFGLATPEATRRAREALALLPPDGDPAALVLAAAALELSELPLKRLLRDLGFPNQPGQVIESAALGSPPLAQALRAARRPSEIAAAVGHHGVETV